MNTEFSARKHSNRQSYKKRSIRWSFCYCGMACFFFALNAMGTSLLTKVVGLVSDQVVTSREVEINRWLDKVIVGGATPGLNANDDIVSKVLIEKAVAIESKPFSILVGEDELQIMEKKVTAYSESTKGRAEWERLETTRKEVRQILETKMKARKFIDFKVKASLLPVSDQEAQKYFQKNRKKFGEASFSQFKESIKNLMSQQSASERMKDWFVVLQKKYRIRKIAAQPDFKSGD